MYLSFECFETPKDPFSRFTPPAKRIRIPILSAHKGSPEEPPLPIEGLQCGFPATISMLPTTRIIVTSNAEQYRVVEITGAPNGSYIRERILSKMCVPDNSYSRYSIYQSEIGAYALGGALNDASLFELCLQYGDPSGSLRFFVSTAPNRPPTRIEPEYPPDNNYHSSRRYRRA